MKPEGRGETWASAETTLVSCSLSSSYPELSGQLDFTYWSRVYM